MKDVKTVLIYGQPNCPDCDKAKMLAQLKQHNMKYLELGKDYTLAELEGLLGKRPRKSPQIFLQEGESIESLGSYSAYRKWAYK